MSDHIERLKFVMRAGSAAGSKSGEVIYRCWVNCDDIGIPFQCSADGCSERVLYDCKYCPEHLRAETGVYIAPSQTGFGMGLFTAREFARGDRIAHYGGEIVTAEETEWRYGCMCDDDGEYIVVTAPYALGIDGTENSRDAVRIRGAGSYCNSPKGTDFKANARLGCRFIRASKALPANTEVFVCYGSEYWTLCGPEHMSHETKVEKCEVPIVELGRKRKWD